VISYSHIKKLTEKIAATALVYQYGQPCGKRKRRLS
jgi:hypothetical protein|tara:strand:+ start:4661 stop:4768 length:108 start_codon:yes stop_codon:yes gene_type:complete